MLPRHAQTTVAYSLSLPLLKTRWHNTVRTNCTCFNYSMSITSQTDHTVLSVFIFPVTGSNQEGCSLLRLLNYVYLMVPEKTQKV